jgi:hypothetical protein
MTWKIKQMEFHVKPNLEVGGIEKHIQIKWRWHFNQSEVENSLRKMKLLPTSEKLIQEGRMKCTKN